MKVNHAGRKEGEPRGSRWAKGRKVRSEKEGIDDNGRRGMHVPRLMASPDAASDKDCTVLIERMAPRDATAEYKAQAVAVALSPNSLPPQTACANLIAVSMTFN